MHFKRPPFVSGATGTSQANDKDNPARMTSVVSRDRHLTLVMVDLSDRPFIDHGRFAYESQALFRVQPGGFIKRRTETKERN
jgi:hypothetical protein